MVHGKRAIAFILVLISIPAVLFVDLYVTPWRVPTRILYAIPIMVAGRLFSIQATVLVIIVTIGFSIIDAALVVDDVQSELLSILALAIVGVLSLMWASAERRSAALAEERAHLHELERRRALELEESRVRLLDFFSMVAHDLRGPLTTIGGFTDILARPNTLPPAQREKIAATMKSSIRQIVRLADDLMDASRVGTGRFEINKGPCDLLALAREIVEQRRPMAPNHRLVLDARVERLEARCDAQRITQAISNLVDNAIKYSPNGGEVRVVVERVGERARITVSDQGTGIAPEDVSRLFQPYVRVGRTQGVKGMGLGLYIVKGIIEAHNGTITVRSELGKGSSFIVDLPTTDPPEVPAQL